MKKAQTQKIVTRFTWFDNLPTFMGELEVLLGFTITRRKYLLHVCNLSAVFVASDQY